MPRNDSLVSASTARRDSKASDSSATSDRRLVDTEKSPEPTVEASEKTQTHTVESRKSNDTVSQDHAIRTITEGEKAGGSVAEKEHADDEVEDESRYLTGWKLAMLSIGLCLTTFVIALDNTIIATAIPKITSYFNSLEDVGWYGSSYLLTTTSLQPSFGRVYTYFDVKYTYLVALVIFEIGSVICAAATSSPMFIIGRAVAGAGAAALNSGGMTIVGFSVPLRKRAIYIAALSSMFGIASVVGPILGGVFTDQLRYVLPMQAHARLDWTNFVPSAGAIAFGSTYPLAPSRLSSSFSSSPTLSANTRIFLSKSASRILILLAPYSSSVPSYACF